MTEAAPPQLQPAPARSSSPDLPTPPVVLVLQNGKQLSIRNYAVMDGAFWDFTKQPARKILLSTVDIAASEKATEESGGEFPSLSSSR